MTERADKLSMRLSIHDVYNHTTSCSRSGDANASCCLFASTKPSISLCRWRPEPNAFWESFRSPTLRSEKRTELVRRESEPVASLRAIDPRLTRSHGRVCQCLFFYAMNSRLSRIQRNQRLNHTVADARPTEAAREVLLPGLDSCWRRAQGSLQRGSAGFYR